MTEPNDTPAELKALAAIELARDIHDAVDRLMSVVDQARNAGLHVTLEGKLSTSEIIYSVDTIKAHVALYITR